MKRVTLMLKPRKGLRLISSEAWVDKRGRTVERVTVWVKVQKENANV